MPILPLALPPQSNQHEQPHGGVAALINAYVVPGGDERKSKISIRAAAGLEALVTLDTSGGIRGVIEVDGVLYAVAGRTIYQVDSGGNAVLIGGLPSDGYVGLARNQRGTGVQIIVVCDGLSFVIVGGTLTQITDSDLPPAVDVCVINRSAIFVSADGRMVRSEIDDATSVDGLDLARAEAVPDGILRVIDRGSEIIVIGPRSVEIWQDVGAEAFGFSRNTVINVGAVSASSVTKATVLGEIVTDAVFWLAADRAGRFAGAVMLASNTPRKISNAWVDTLIDKEPDKTAIVATSWVERGRAFVAWRLSSTTIVYDTSTGLWHERQSRDAYGNLTAWNVGLCTVLGGRVVGAHVSEPVLYWVDPDICDEDGSEMIWRVRTPPLNAFPGRVEAHRVYLDMVPGVGLGSGASQDTDPVVTLRLSTDGKTWRDCGSARLGQQGQDQTRVYWSRLGTFPAATFEFTCSAAVARELLSASWSGTTLPP